MRCCLLYSEQQNRVPEFGQSGYAVRKKPRNLLILVDGEGFEPPTPAV